MSHHLSKDYSVTITRQRLKFQYLPRPSALLFSFRKKYEYSVRFSKRRYSFIGQSEEFSACWGKMCLLSCRKRQLFFVSRAPLSSVLLPSKYYKSGLFNYNLLYECRHQLYQNISKMNPNNSMQSYAFQSGHQEQYVNPQQPKPATIKSTFMVSFFNCQICSLYIRHFDVKLFWYCL